MREGRKQGEEESKEKWKSEVTGGTDSGLQHPAIEDGENSYSLRESGSLGDATKFLQ